MIIRINQAPRELPEPISLAEALARFSPYGDEPVIVSLNGERVEQDAALPLKDGDELTVFPFLIGG